MCNRRFEYRDTLMLISLTGELFFELTVRYFTGKKFYRFWKKEAFQINIYPTNVTHEILSYQWLYIELLLVLRPS